MKTNLTWGLLLFVFLGAFGVMEGCSPPNSSEEVVSDASSHEHAAEHKAEQTKDAGETVKETTPKPEPRPEPKPEPASEPKAEPTPEPSPEPSVERKAEPNTEPSQEVVPEDGGSGDVVPEKVQPPHPCKSLEIDGGTFEFFTPNQPWLGGVKVCQMGTTNCQTSIKAAGGFRLKNLPLNKDFYLTFEKAGHEKLLVPMHVPFSSVDPKSCAYRYSAGMVPKQLSALITAGLGIKLVPGTSIVVADVADLKKVAVTGVSVSINPVKGKGPYYLTAKGGVNSKPETTGLGIGLFVNVPAGTYEVSYKHGTKKCTAWPTAIQNAKKTAAKVTLPATGGPWLVLASGQCQ